MYFVQRKESETQLPLTDPINALEAIGQGMFDTADEKGMAYSIGYVTGDVVASVLVDKGIGKAEKVAAEGWQNIVKKWQR